MSPPELGAVMAPVGSAPRAAAARAAAGSVRRVLLLGATFATDNRGVGALASGAITILARRFPGAEIAFLDYGRHADVAVVDVGGREASVPLVNLRFSWKVLLRNNVAYLLVMAALARVLGAGFARRAKAGNPWLRSIADADLAVAVSGGDSFSDIYGLGRFFYVYLPQLLVLLLGKKLVLLPQTIGPFEGRVARTLAAQLMSDAEIVYSRDRPGVREARDLLGGRGDSSKLRFCPDMGFILEPRRPDGASLREVEAIARGGRPLVGLNVSGLLLMGGYSRDNAFDLKGDYRTLVERTIAWLIDDGDADVVLVPHVFGTQDESDATACARLFDALGGRYPGRLHCLRCEYDQNEIKYAIGRCDFFVGARMHACIAALSQAIPAVGIAYSKKFAGVFDTVGAADLVADPRELDTEAIVAVIAGAFQRRDETRARLEMAMRDVRTALLASLDEVG